MFVQIRSNTGKPFYLNFEHISKFEDGYGRAHDWDEEAVYKCKITMSNSEVIELEGEYANRFMQTFFRYVAEKGNY